METYDLAGKVVLITGGARGIGFETAKQAYERGASVAIVDLDPDLAAESAEAIGDRATGIGANVADAAEVEAAVATAVTRLGRVDVVIANAGITPRKTTTRDISIEEWERVVEVNLLGVWRTIRAGIEQVIENRGHFVLISSAYATANGLLNSSYATSKAAVESLGRSLRTELTPHGASASVAYFAFVNTGLIGEIFDNPKIDALRQELVPDFMTEPIEADQVAGAVLDGIEQRSARIIEPSAWRPPFKWRGLVGPLSDLRIERNRMVGETVREIETPDEHGYWVNLGPAPLDYDLAGKTVFVTGGAQGIGLETARQAYGRGASVVLVDLDPEQVGQAADGLGERALGLAADVTDRASIEGAMEAAVERFGKVDVVVANAGIATIGTIRSMSTEDWERVVEVNLFGVWRTVRAGMEQVVENRGQFVLVSSSYAFNNGVLNSPYAAAKSGVEALGRALRAELRPLGASATVAYFGFIKTEMVRKGFENPFGDRLRQEVVPKPLTRQVPVSDAGGVIIEALEGRSARAIAPAEWKALFFARGLTAPLMDQQFDNDPSLMEIILDAERADRDPGDAATD